MSFVLRLPPNFDLKSPKVGFKQYDLRYFFIWLFGTIFFMAMMAPICYYLTTSDSLLVDTESDFIKTLFYRLNVFTSYVSIGNYLYYAACMVLGWAYVRLIACDDWRWHNLFRHLGKYDCMWDLLKTTIAFCVINVNVVFKHKYDLVGYCDDPSYKLE